MGCGFLGVLYQYGQGVRQNYSKAKELYIKACNMGFKLGCKDYEILIKMGY